MVDIWGNTKGYEYNNDVEYYRVPRNGYPYNVAKLVSQLDKHGSHYDLIHVFNRPRDLLIYKSASPASRFVLSLLNEMFKEGKIIYELGNLVIEACDRIMTVSKYIKSAIALRFPNSDGKTEPVYSGVDLKKYSTIWDDRSMVNVCGLNAFSRFKNRNRKLLKTKEYSRHNFRLFLIKGLLRPW